MVATVVVETDDVADKWVTVVDMPVVVVPGVTVWEDCGRSDESTGQNVGFTVC